MDREIERLERERERPIPILGMHLIGRESGGEEYHGFVVS